MRIISSSSFEKLLDDKGNKFPITSNGASGKLSADIQVSQHETEEKKTISNSPTSDNSSWRLGGKNFRSLIPATIFSFFVNTMDPT